MLNTLYNKTLGISGEAQACSFLEQQGFAVLAKNYRVRQGEIDLVVERDDVIAFVEVKTRTKNYFPTSQVITPSKQRKITAAARHFILTQNPPRQRVFRFDVIIVHAQLQNQIEHIANAFYSRI